MIEKTALLLNELTPAQKKLCNEQTCSERERPLSRLSLLVFLYSLFLFKETGKKYTILDYLRRRFHLGYYRLVSNEIPCRRMQ